MKKHSLSGSLFPFFFDFVLYSIKFMSLDTGEVGANSAFADMDMKYVPLVCYYDGQLQQNASHPIYVGGHMKADRVRSNICFLEFVGKMHELCKPLPRETNICIKCRYLLDQHNSIAMAVEDDISLSIIMDLHPHQCNAIVVYIVEQPDDKSSTTSQRHEKGSSSCSEGDCNYVAKTSVKFSANQSTSKGLESNDSLAIDIYSSSPRDSSLMHLSQRQGLKRYSNLTGHHSRSEGVHLETNSKKSDSWFRMRIFDPKDLFIQKWQKRFVLFSVLALAVDALFFYTPGIDGEKSCLSWNGSLEITACVLRSIADIILIGHIVFQFRTGFFVPSSRVFGRGEFVKDLRVIATRYLSSTFLIDVLAVLPLPQVLILIIMPRMSGSMLVNKGNSLQYVLLLQYIPRFLRVYYLYKELRRGNKMNKTVWLGVVVNFSLYMLGSHIFGAFWYFLSVGRESICWQDACRKTATCNLYSLYCGDHNTGANEFVRASCPTIEQNSSLFDFGIYLDVLQTGIPNSSFLEKLIYCFWWALRNIGSFGQNLKTSAYIWEVVFALSISVSSVFLFMLLMGNVQTYLQSETVKSEKAFRKKLQDTEKWMSRMFLPRDLRQQIRQYELFIWQTTRGFDEEALLRKLPKDIKRDIKRHLCLALLMEVPVFGKMDEQFLDALCDRLKPVLYAEDNLIIREGHPVDEMLFIMSGELLSGTTNGGNTENFNCYLKAGDYIGEELLPWAIIHTNSSKPISTRTVQALKEVEAFALMGDDLKAVVSQFRLQGKELRHTLRFYSPRWRTWAACFIQAAWRRHHRKKQEKIGWEKEMEYKDRLAEIGGNKISFGAAIFASKFAANAVRLLRRNSTQSTMLRQATLSFQKPDEPEVFAEDP